MLKGSENDHSQNAGTGALGTPHPQSGACRGSDPQDRKDHVICIGGGPASLTAAYLLTQQHWPVTVLEADTSYWGGIARTVEHNGFRYDIGGHRFFSKSAEVNELWREILGDDFIEVSRKSRIVYNNSFFNYPLQLGNVLSGLGVLESALCFLSFVRAQLTPYGNIKSFEQWVSKRFGRRLFNTFFKTYTEKVWGMDCADISADWAAQRINQLSLWKAVTNAIVKNRSKQPVIKTLIDHFHYPRLGPGMMWEVAAKKVAERGGRLLMGHRVERLERRQDGWEVVCAVGDQDARFTASHIISSAPLGDFVANLSPQPPQDVVAACANLRHRDFIVVCLKLRDWKGFDDNWLYIHDSKIRVGRIQNFQNWSSEMVPPGFGSVGMEYFCFAGDGLWNSSDATLIELATAELVSLGIATATQVDGGLVIRQPKAYPIYDEGYTERVATVRRFVETQCPGLQMVGRNGTHRYNNQDHSMMTAMLAVENITKSTRHDIWKVNIDAQLCEDGALPDNTRLVPQRVS